MPLAAMLVEQLRLLGADPDGAEQLAAALGRLGRDVAAAVPSCRTVSIILPHPAGEITVTVADGPGAVLASVAVALPAAAGSALPGGVLVLRAGVAGAFTALARDLGALLGAGQPPIVLDRHLSWAAEPFTAALTELRAIEQAVGVLVDRGTPPEAARRELRRRADYSDTTVGAASRALLAALRAPDGKV